MLVFFAGVLFLSRKSEKMILHAKAEKSTKFSVKYLASAGIIAALYVALTLVSAIFGMSSGVIQIRISEMLCILPVYTTAAIPGVTIGCLVANLLTGGTIYDIIFGTLATLIGVVCACHMTKFKYLSFIPTVAANAVIIPFVLILSGIGGYDMFPFYSLTVGAGELISCGIFGAVLIRYFETHKSIAERIFK